VNDEIARLKSDYEEEIALLKYDIEKRNDLLKKALTSNLWEVRGTLREEIDDLLNPPWYNSIPKQGVLCWVDDSEAIDIITRIEPGLDYKFIGLYARWDTATPLTNEEIEDFKR
jgi:hypothetical protein